jgi:hypothetical protein
MAKALKEEEYNAKRDQLDSVWWLRPPARPWRSRRCVCFAKTTRQQENSSRDLPGRNDFCQFFNQGRKLIPHSIPNLTDIYHIILVYDQVPHAGHFTLFDLRKFRSRFRRDPPSSLPNDLDTANYGVLALSVFKELIPGFIEYVIQRDFRGF